MDLILWRHAEAEDGMPDASRALTDKGLKQAKRMAKWLRERLPNDVRVIASPAKRAQQTAAALAQDFSTVAEIGAGTSVKSLLAAAGWPKAKGAVVVVGHQPTLGQVAAQLLAGAEAEWSIKKGAVLWLSSRDDEIVLKVAISPDLV